MNIDFGVSLGFAITSIGRILRKGQSPAFNMKDLTASRSRVLTSTTLEGMCSILLSDSITIAITLLLSPLTISLTEPEHGETN